MPPPFHNLTLPEFARALDRFPFTRRINAVHMHHTWRPDHEQYRGHESIVALWRYHTQTNGWSEIAQQVTIAPDGTIWTGRNWNQPPVSAAGHNGNRAAGPFMVELIGDFDHGRDRFEGEQRRVALRVVALVQKKFNLAPETLRFHSQLSAKSCPGTSVDYDETVGEVRDLHATPRDLEAAPAAEGTGMDSGPFDADMLAGHAMIALLTRDLPARDDPPEAEPEEDAMSDTQLHALFGGDGATRAARPGSGAARAGQREAPLPPEVLNALSPHVINLTLGRFSSDGQLTTTPGDVDAIFEDYLARALEGARARREPLRLLFYAHGGLVKESAGLRIAEKHVSWWMRNNVYPIHFVWETGLFETLGQVLGRSRQAVRGVTRDIFDYTTDPVIEELARALYGPRIWSGMKRSAELAVGEEGGARYVAHKLKEFCDTHADEVRQGQVELHAIGHSAGSIFHAHFLPTAAELGVPSFRSAHFLAPAIRADAFKRRLADRLGKDRGIDQLTVFTMKNTRERDDECIGVYHKSLLYLIYHALEAERKTPILGLEISLRNDTELKNLFGLGAARSDKGDVVWSDTPLDSGRSASRALRHGDFDDDPPTMNSVARRILGADDNDPIKDYPAEPAGARGLDPWENQVDWPEGLDFSTGVGAPVTPPLPARPPVQPSVSVPVTLAAPAGLSAAKGGRLRALCVGINEYPTAPLSGCVPDAWTWQATLANLGFNPITVLLDHSATRDAILTALGNMVTTSVAGDVVVFQFAGHGTQLQDISADETDEDTPEQDEAICPIDFADGAFVVDDDIGAIFEQTPPGVNVTCFIDCCHSGTISRFGVGAPSPAGVGRRGPLPRFLVATPEMQAAHRRFRQRQGTRRAAGTRGLSAMKEVLFAACLSSEVAYENAGRGDFTTRATQALQSGTDGLTNEGFEQQVITAFGAGAIQHPRLYCHPDARSLGFLQPLAGGWAEGGWRAGGRSRAVAAGPGGQAATTAQLLRLAASLLDERARG